MSEHDNLDKWIEQRRAHYDKQRAWAHAELRRLYPGLYRNAPHMLFDVTPDGDFTLGLTREEQEQVQREAEAPRRAVVFPGDYADLVLTSHPDGTITARIDPRKEQ